MSTAALKFKSFTELPRWFRRLCAKGNLDKIEKGIKVLMAHGWKEDDLMKVALRDIKIENRTVQ